MPLTARNEQRDIETPEYRRGAVRLCAMAIAVGIAGCGEPPAPTAPIRPVQTMTVDPQRAEETFSQTGEIKARYETDLAFRLAGRIVARKVDVGGVVKADDELAVLDDQDQQNAFDAAESDVAGARAQVAEAAAQESRTRELLKNGYATRAKYDEALRNLRTAEAKLRSAEANLRVAEDRVAYTVLEAPSDGVVTAVGADPGQVVGAGQMVVRLANPGEKEAVFAVAESRMTGAPRDPVVEVALLSDPNIKTTGRVRERSPSADPVTRTFTVKVSLPDAPAQMRLGAAVTGRVSSQGEVVVVLPATALFQKDQQPAVWVVDSAASSVQLKPITILRYDADSFVVKNGLSKGDVVVTAGVQKLSPGQKVRLLSGS